MLRQVTIGALWAVVLLLPACAQRSIPVRVHRYNAKTEVREFPDEILGEEQPTILAFLSADDRRCDRYVKPLRALSARKDVKLVGVLTYEENGFIKNLTTERDLTFPTILDPGMKLFNRYRVTRYPTFVYLSTEGKELDRKYDLKDLREWYLPQRIRKAKSVKPKSVEDLEATPEEQLEAEEILDPPTRRSDLLFQRGSASSSVPPERSTPN